MKTVYYELTGKLNGEEQSPIEMLNFRAILPIARKMKSEPQWTDVKLRKITLTAEEIPLVPMEE